MYIGGILGVNGGTGSTKTSSGSVSETAKTPKDFEFSINPEFSYFVADNFRVGVYAGIGFNSKPTSQDSNDNWLKQKSTTFSVGPVFAYYIKLADKLYYTPEIGLGFAYSKGSQDLSTSQSYSLNIMGFYGSIYLAALEFRPTPKFGMVVSLATIGFGSMSSKEEEIFGQNVKISSSAFSYNIGLDPTIGIRYYF